MPQVQPSKKRKTCITLVALVCNSIEIQRTLPQILIGNYRTFLKRDIEAVMRECAPNMIVIRYVSLTFDVGTLVFLFAGSVADGATRI